MCFMACAPSGSFVLYPLQLRIREPLFRTAEKSLFYSFPYTKLMCCSYTNPTLASPKNISTMTPPFAPATDDWYHPKSLLPSHIYAMFSLAQCVKNVAPINRSIDFDLTAGHSNVVVVTMARLLWDPGGITTRPVSPRARRVWDPGISNTSIVGRQGHHPFLLRPTRPMVFRFPAQAQEIRMARLLTPSVFQHCPTSMRSRVPPADMYPPPTMSPRRSTVTAVRALSIMAPLVNHESLFQCSHPILSWPTVPNIQ